MHLVLAFASLSPGSPLLFLFKVPLLIVLLGQYWKNQSGGWESGTIQNCMRKLKILNKK